MVWRRTKTVDRFTDEDWVSAGMYCTKSEYNRLRRVAVKAGILEGGAVHDIRMETASEIGQYQRAHDGERMKQYNDDLIEWQKITIGSLRANMLRMGMKRGELYNSLFPTQKKNKYGEINRLGFGFARHGIFIYKGAYEGYGGRKGSRWSYRKKTKHGYINTSEMRQTNRHSLGKLSDSRMKDRDWFNPVIEKRMERLSEICLAYCDTMIVDATKIYIKR